MARFGPTLKHAVATFFAAGLATQVFAEETALDPLFDSLRDADPDAAAMIEQRIWEEWSRTGSPSMDLLLDRGREALEAGEIKQAIAHFSALIDHAPAFAEGYNARAMAHFQNDAFGLAMEDIRRTLELNPRHFGALSGLALILTDLGFEDDALAAWRAAAALNPHQEGAAEAIERLERRVEGESL